MLEGTSSCVRLLQVATLTWHNGHHCSIITQIKTSMNIIKARDHKQLSLLCFIGRNTYCLLIPIVVLPTNLYIRGFCRRWPHCTIDTVSAQYIRSLPAITLHEYTNIAFPVHLKDTHCPCTDKVYNIMTILTLQDFWPALQFWNWTQNVLQ